MGVPQDHASHSFRLTRANVPNQSEAWDERSQVRINPHMCPCLSSSQPTPLTDKYDVQEACCLYDSRWRLLHRMGGRHVQSDGQTRARTLAF